MTFPEHVVDRVAAAMYEHGEIDYVEAVYPDGPWSGWGWVCKCGEVLRPASPVPAGVAQVGWWHKSHVARTALEAAGFRRQVVPGETRVNVRWVAMTDWEWE